MTQQPATAATPRPDGIALRLAGQPLTGEDGHRDGVAVRWIAAFMRSAPLWLLGAPGLVLSIVVGYRSVAPSTGLAASWPVPLFILVMAWPEQRLHARGLLRGVGWVLALTVVTTTVMGEGPLEGLRMASGNVMAGLALLATYRRLLPGAGWFPSRVAAIGLWFALVPLAGALAVLLGGIPHGRLGGTGDLSRDLWWVARYNGAVLAGSFFVSAYVFDRRAAASRPILQRWWPVLMALSMGGLLLPFALPEYPLTCLVFIPAVWLGLCLPPREAVLGGICVSIVYSVLSARVVPVDAITDNDLLPCLARTTVMSCALTLTFMMSVLRENNARLEEQLREQTEVTIAQNEVVGTVVNAVPDGIVLLTSDGRVVMANPAARTLLGRRGTHASTWISELDLRDPAGVELPPSRWQALAHPPVEGSRELLSLRRGDERLVCAVATRSIVHLGHTFVLVVFTDVTAGHSLEAELEDFAGTVAGDLRQPLDDIGALVAAAAEDLRRGEGERGVAGIRAARDTSTRVRDRIDGYLAFTVSRQATMSPAPVDLIGCLEEVLAGRSPGQVTVEVERQPTGDPVPVVVHADRPLLRRLLDTLVQQAVSRSESASDAAPRVVIRLGRSLAGWVTISVTDSGTRPSDADLAGLFDPFAGDKAGESGLGLAVCATIVERHGGTITAGRAEHGGTRIDFTLPLGGVLAA